MTQYIIPNTLVLPAEGYRDVSGSSREDFKLEER